MPARVWASGVVSIPTRIAGTPRGSSSPVRAPRERRPRARGPSPRSSSRRVERVADRRGERLRALRVGADGGVAAGLVERRVRRGDDRRAGRHRLGDRHPEALEARRVDDDRGAAVEPRELARRRRGRAGRRRARSSCGCSPQPCAADDGERELGVGEQREGLDERAEVLARLERRDGQQRTGAPRSAPLPAGVNSAPIPGCATTIRSRGNAERLGDVVGRERRVGEDDVAGARGVRGTCGACIERVRGGHPLREVERHEVVDRRRAEPGALRRVHPVGEVEDVERAEPALGRRPAEPRPRRAPAVRAGKRLQAQLERNAGERLRDRARGPAARSARTRRPRRPRAPPPRRARAASRGCSCSRPSARARAARRRRRSSRGGR